MEGGGAILHPSLRLTATRFLISARNGGGRHRGAFNSGPKSRRVIPLDKWLSDARCERPALSDYLSTPSAAPCHTKYLFHLINCHISVCGELTRLSMRRQRAFCCFFSLSFLFFFFFFRPASSIGGMLRLRPDNRRQKQQIGG